MNTSVDIIFIVMIVCVAFATYMNLFKGWAEWHWRLGNFRGWLLPNDKDAYVKTTKLPHVLTLVG